MPKEENENEILTRREKGMIRMRSIMDYGMGIMWMSMGVFLMFIKYFNTDFTARYDENKNSSIHYFLVYFNFYALY